jgi:hypothetical protein
MFQVLSSVACQDAAFCAPAGTDESAAYRTTPASGDPYRYIRSGSYKTILCSMGPQPIDCAKPKKNEQAFFQQE